MKKFLSLLVLLSVASCSFQVDVLEPPSLTPTLEASATARSTTTLSVPTLTPTATPPSLPTTAPSAAPPILTGPSDSSSIVPIVFSADATSQIVMGRIEEGGSQTYSLNAFEGQTMSVSLLPEKANPPGTFQLEIRGRDGVALCPSNDSPCPFWRGVLPSTQEYLIKVSPQQAGAFSMRVAINPPGTVSQLFNYADPDGDYALTYSDEFAPSYYHGAEVTRIPPGFTLQYIDTQQYTTTNLSEVYFLVGGSDDPQKISTCTEPLSFGGPEIILGDTTVNGINFTKSQVNGHAAGNIYEQVYYRTVHDGSCYEVTYFVHYGNIGAYVPGTVAEFDRTALYQQLDEILASLILK